MEYNVQQINIIIVLKKNKQIKRNHIIQVTAYEYFKFTKGSMNILVFILEDVDLINGIFYIWDV